MRNQQFDKSRGDLQFKEHTLNQKFSQLEQENDQRKKEHSELMEHLRQKLDKHSDPEKHSRLEQLEKVNKELRNKLMSEQNKSSM